MGTIAVFVAAGWTAVALVVIAMCRASARADARSDALLAAHHDPLIALAMEAESAGAPALFARTAAENERAERGDAAAEDEASRAGGDRQLVLVTG